MRMLALAFVSLLAACAGVPDRRTPVVPLGAPTPAVDLSKDQARRAASDHSPPAPVVEPAVGGDAQVSYRTVTRIVEVQAAAPVAPAPAGSEQMADPQGNDQGYRGERGEQGGSRGGSSDSGEPWFPIGTMLGAGIGSAIGHHNGNSAEGAWIGAGVGMLFDLSRLW